METVIIALILATYHPPVVVAGFPEDTGMGKCKMDQHYHNADHMCHRDTDDSAVRPLVDSWKR